MRTIFGVFISEWQFAYFKIQVDVRLENHGITLFPLLHCILINFGAT